MKTKKCLFCKNPAKKKFDTKNQKYYFVRYCSSHYYQKYSKGRKYNPLWNKKHARKIKMIVLNFYGKNKPECSCCKEKHIEFLVMDHIKGGGNKHKKRLKISGGLSLYKWIIKNKFPKKLRILCDNCNMSLGRYGYCPHYNFKKQAV